MGRGPTWEAWEEEITWRYHQEGRTIAETIQALKSRGSDRGENSVRHKREGLRQVHSHISSSPDVSLIKLRKPRILYFDIETTDFKGGPFGELLMMGYRWEDEDDYKIIHIYDYKGWNKERLNLRDKQIVKAASEIISSADVLVGHYSPRFDLPFIQTRLAVHRLPPVAEPKHIDTWRICAKQLAFSSNRLGKVAEYLGVPQQKGEVSLATWRASKAHELWALEELSEYCIQDVKTTYEVMQVLKPIAREWPSMNLLTGGMVYECPCGSYRVAKNGFYLTKVNKYDRYKCKDCGRWTRGRQSVVDKATERMMK